MLHGETTSHKARDVHNGNQSEVCSRLGVRGWAGAARRGAPGADLPFNAWVTSRKARRLQEKTGRKIKFSSRVEVRSFDPESVRGRYEARGVNASFFSLFSWPPFCVLPSTNPPFQSADAEDCEEFEMNSTSLTTGSVIITFFLSNIFLACL
jgi:hypothetical protein